MTLSKHLDLVTKLSLSPLEGTIIKELNEAGSEEIVTIIATVHHFILREDQKLSTIGIAIKRLCNLNLTRFSKIEYCNYKNMLIAVDNDTVNMIYNYLTICSWSDWWLRHYWGPCEKIELEIL
jgi:lipoate-protein ligase B